MQQDDNRSQTLTTLQMTQWFKQQTHYFSTNTASNHETVLFAPVTHIITTQHMQAHFLQITKPLMILMHASRSPCAQQALCIAPACRSVTLQHPHESKPCLPAAAAAGAGGYKAHRVMPAVPAWASPSSCLGMCCPNLVTHFYGPYVWCVFIPVDLGAIGFFTSGPVPATVKTTAAGTTTHRACRRTCTMLATLMLTCTLSKTIEVRHATLAASWLLVLAGMVALQIERHTCIRSIITHDDNTNRSKTSKECCILSC